MDGKAGAAFFSIKHGIENCLNSSIKSGCELKLLGDLYSFGASFPFKVFCDDDNPIQDMEYCFQKQLEFVTRGEEAFRSSLTSFGDEEDMLAIKSSILCDIALNILLQAQLMSSIQIDSDNNPRSRKVIARYDRAAEAFRQAIEYNPIHAPSWCGLGCSVLKEDPLLAQHAFSRCVQIESMSPDAYANVGFMYTSKLAINASRSTMEALTQIWNQPDRADLWLSLAKVFIENSAIESAKIAVSRAACMSSQELMSSSRINSRTLSFVDSKTISEAISLEYWLKEIQTKKPGPTYRLQRALMMNPGNAVARKGLLLAEAKSKKKKN
ncbi:hypothetical protein FRACYDRAFT_242879 [Fragilariopsis cylindrus CCMP1102]|uniref:TPR-like protein n=1 Tax=Fragilariopsis cylindrus CCMP1102 TaxID=635003 RepID=A0A1E7F4T4_9STRA|nr:hypothetical protein FRACYDRAFT_242879 [Fragilariopsis cylindrus CCMP1102]|eukprot:OEU13149.1 hypothetical protein FRACYDRAFT_242879 [Fragilariopsis cylindrus CCMP1102]